MTTNETGAPLSSGGSAVRVIRPRAGSIRTTSSAPRANSSQPAIAPSREWPRVVTATGGGDAVGLGGSVVGPGARAGRVGPA